MPLVQLRKDRIERIAAKFKVLRNAMDERSRRLWVAMEAREAGYGGISLVSEATGVARATIVAGIKEVEMGPVPGSERPRIRRPGAGRKELTARDPGLREALERLVDPTTRGDPMSPLRWTCKSTRVLAEELTRQGHRVEHQRVSELLQEAGYSLQANRKTREGDSHPDRNAQFEYIAAQSRAFQERGQPVISVDTKKKELIGDFKNGGREWHPKGAPENVRVHDFLDKEQGKAIPYGVYDVSANAGWVSVGTDHDTPEFAVQSINRWWKKMGQRAYPDAKELLITADGGGSNGYRARLWKRELQGMADKTGLRITVCHFPPGTSKWNKIEHRMFCHITENWRGRPLVSHEVVVNLIAHTTTTKGLRIRAGLDTRKYELGIKVAKDELESLSLDPHRFHGDWNYTMSPRST